MTPRILVTGFQPFLHHSVNSSERVLANLSLQDTAIETLLLPVSFEGSFQALQNHLAKNLDYDFVVMLGQAQSRASITVERVALNWMESKKPDNDGRCIEGQRILPGGPDSYLIDFFPSAWIEKIAANQGPQKSIEISLTAGAYVCNNLYYKTTHSLRGKKTKPLFVHLPLLPEQESENPHAPTMELETQTHILRELLALLKATS